jgi:hypothetical protein
LVFLSCLISIFLHILRQLQSWSPDCHLFTAALVTYSSEALTDGNLFPGQWAWERGQKLSCSTNTTLKRPSLQVHRSFTMVPLARSFQHLIPYAYESISRSTGRCTLYTTHVLEMYILFQFDLYPNETMWSITHYHNPPRLLQILYHNCLCQIK